MSYVAALKGDVIVPITTIPDIVTRAQAELYFPEIKPENLLINGVDSTGKRIYHIH